VERAKTGRQQRSLYRRVRERRMSCRQPIGTDGDQSLSETNSRVRIVKTWYVDTWPRVSDRHAAVRANVIFCWIFFFFSHDCRTERSSRTPHSWATITRGALQSKFYCCAMLCKHGLCRHAVSVRLSVGPSITFVDSVEMNKHIFKTFFTTGYSHTIIQCVWESRTTKIDITSAYFTTFTN